jgi:hypothetical protein
MRAHLRFLLAVLALGLGLGAAAGLSTSPLSAATADLLAPTGFGHIDDMGTYKFCHCGVERACYPCANWPPSTTEPAPVTPVTAD